MSGDAGVVAHESDAAAPKSAGALLAASARPPLHIGFWAWMRERFPPGHAVLFVVLYLAAAVTAQALLRGGPVRLVPADVLSAVAAYAFFLMLRIFDEHKDFAADAVNHPERALQRGWITLGHLRALGAVAIVLQASVSIARDGGIGASTGWWLVAFGWSLLMAAEFFVPEMLRPQLLLYAATHMVVMPLIMLWLAHMGVNGAVLPWSVGWLAALSFTSGFAFEIARKTKAPNDEQRGVDSYSSILGPRRAALLTSALVIVSAGVAARTTLLVADGRESWMAIAVQLAVAAIIVWQLSAFAASPTTGAARRCEKLVSVALLVFHVAIIAAVVAERGFRA